MSTRCPICERRVKIKGDRMTTHGPGRTIHDLAAGAAL